jgi:multidrug efflux pump subunit AcrA (membrane-fusion protein)
MNIIAINPDQVYQNQQGQYIYVVDDNNTVQVKQINPIFSNNDMVILSKTFIGERVVTETIRAITSGVLVNPIEVNNTILISD